MTRSQLKTCVFAFAALSVAALGASARGQSVGKIVIRGLEYNDHTANTVKSTDQVNGGDFFEITTFSLFFGQFDGGLAKTTKVVLQDVNAPSATSGGVTVFELKNVAPWGQTLTVQSPDLAILRGRTFYVSVFVNVPDGTRHYANAGTLRIN